MTTRLEALRSFGQWVKIADLGPEPYVIKSNVSQASRRHVILQDEEGTEAVLLTLPSIEDDLAKTLTGALGKPIFDIEAVKILEPGHTVFIEGVLPGNTKSETLRLTQE